MTDDTEPTGRALATDQQPLCSIAQAGVFVLVGYHGRQARDLYLAIKDEPVHCCQCEADLAEGELTEHVWVHAPKRVQQKRERALRSVKECH